MVGSHASLPGRYWLRCLILALAAISPLLLPTRASATFAERVESMFLGDDMTPPVAGRADGGVVQGETCHLFNRLRADATSTDRFRALVPTTNLSTTVSPHPTFWFYLPVDNTAEAGASYVEFDVRDEGGRSLLPDGAIQTPVPDQPSIVGFRLPETAESLQMGRQYTWQLTLGCDAAHNADDPFVYGQVERITVADDLIFDLAAAPPDGKFTAYANSLVWSETVTALAQNATNYTDDWTTLLAMFELEAIAPDIAIQEFVELADPPPFPSSIVSGGEQAIGRSRAGVVQQNACNLYNRARIDAASEASLIALMPDSNQATTVLPYPTFWFYLPLAQSEDTPVQHLEFELRDEAGSSVLGQEALQMALPDQPGIVSITLPNSLAPLQVGSRYNWKLTLACDIASNAPSPFVYGWVERLATDEALIYELETTPAAIRYAVFAENQIWSEMVNQLARQRHNQPQRWREFLSLFGLEAVAEDVEVESLSF